jgi:pyruvate kinase
VDYDSCIKPHKPFAFPGKDMREMFNLDVITQRDVIDIDECINCKPQGADYIGIQFVSCAQDIIEARELL